MSDDQDDQKNQPNYVMFRLSDRPVYLIGELKEETAYDIVLYWPATLSIYSDDDGVNTITSKYMLFAEGDVVSILKNSIQSIATPKAHMIGYYLAFRKRWQGEVETKFENSLLGVKTQAAPEAPKETALTDEMPEGSKTVH